MARRKNSTLIKALILTPYLILLYILQSTVFTHVTLMGVKPLILPVAVAGVSLFLGRTDGGVFGLFAGMLMDMSYNQITAQFTILLTLLGIFLGVLSDTVLVQGFPSFLVSSLIGLTLISAYQALSLAILRGAPLSVMAVIGLRQSLYSLVFTIPIYYISRFLCRVIGPGKGL